MCVCVWGGSKVPTGAGGRRRRKWARLGGWRWEWGVARCLQGREEGGGGGRGGGGRQGEMGEGGSTLPTGAGGRKEGRKAGDGGGQGD